MLPSLTSLEAFSSSCRYLFCILRPFVCGLNLPRASSLVTDQYTDTTVVLIEQYCYFSYMEELILVYVL